MNENNLLAKKPPMATQANSQERILVGRRKAARMLSISQRSLDYLVANKRLNARRIGARVLLSVSELRRYAQADHPDRVAS